MNDQELQARLASLRQEEPSPEAFRAELHRRLAEQGPPARPARRWWLLLWPLSGVAAGVATFALLASTRAPTVVTMPGPVPVAVKAPAPTSDDPRAGEVLPRYRVPASKVAVINLGFNATVAVADADFDVALPEGLSFVSEGRRLPDRHARWRGDLEPGENEIPIAVRADRPGLYHVRASVVVDGERLDQEIVLEVPPS